MSVSSSINTFLLQNNLRIVDNPCVSPDFCLDWEGLKADLRAKNGIHKFERSSFHIESAIVTLVSNRLGDHAWLVESPLAKKLQEGIELEANIRAYPATFENLLLLKNLVYEFDSASTIFPTAHVTLGKTSLGVGARFTTHHWPAVEWAMSKLGIGLTANQNSIPRELVFDVNEMLAGKLDRVPFPFIGTDVPEGHQGQSVEGMSHGSILSKIKNGFHLRRIPWSFNADHQPIGGKYDAREEKLVRGSLLASYITFDLSPELSQTRLPESEEEIARFIEREISKDILSKMDEGLRSLNLTMGTHDRNRLLAFVWPSLQKMKKRDLAYQKIRETTFTTTVGREYLRELSIDELPGLTTPETSAVMLILCREMGMKIHFLAPAFGFQKNMPYPDNETLEKMIQKTWHVCRTFDVSIGFHSGSGKSAENYQVMGRVTGGRLEIKTSGRYTYEMGRALAKSRNVDDQALWNDWYDFTREIALIGAFSADETEQRMARSFIVNALELEKESPQVFATSEHCRRALEKLIPNPEHMFWFEYNFLYVLAAEGKSSKESLGDHTVAGYRQRARFYRISEEGRLHYAKNVAAYLIFLAKNTGIVSNEKAESAEKDLQGVISLQEFLSQI
ncbi:MAG: tagaturonate epimerase family protein [Verrucomicrobiota bacterium]